MTRLSARQFLCSVCLGCVFLAVAPSTARAQIDFLDRPGDRQKIASLRGNWRFSIGDDPAWANPGYDDRHWTRVSVPDAWEDEGYEGYNGYAWYRRTIRVHADDLAGRRLVLSLGRIDDVDQVFINGQLIGSSGQFPPDYVTAHDADRLYAVPSRCLRPGEDNVIAVRVYDGAGRGGLYGGHLGLYSTTYPELTLELDSIWKFQPGDNLEYSDPGYDDSGFTDVPVPGFWENHGFPNHDGFAWYRTRFSITEKPADETLVLLLGRIDDLDEVYLNGTRIGGTGDLAHPDSNHGVAYYRQNRGYIFPASLLRGENVIAVRVYDNQSVGGIYAGPVGIMTQAEYIALWEQRRRDQSSLWDWIKRID